MVTHLHLTISKSKTILNNIQEISRCKLTITSTRIIISISKDNNMKIINKDAVKINIKIMLTIMIGKIKINLITTGFKIIKMMIKMIKLE